LSRQADPERHASHHPARARHPTQRETERDRERHRERERREKREEKRERETERQRDRDRERGRPEDGIDATVSRQANPKHTPVASLLVRGVELRNHLFQCMHGRLTRDKRERRAR
jgi:hypothetical protein